MNFVNTYIYRITEWIMRFAFVNLLLIGFSFLGLIILGVFPATAAMFSVVRKWIMGHTDIPVFRTFWDTYKKEWLKSNILGAILLSCASLLYLEYHIINTSTHVVVQWSKYPFFLLVVIFSLFLLYVFPTNAHYHVSLIQVLKNAFFIMLVNPFYNIVMILGLILIYLLAQILPPLVLFFGGSTTAFFIMWSCYQSFLNIERKKERLKSS